MCTHLYACEYKALRDFLKPLKVLGLLKAPRASYTHAFILVFYTIT